MVIVYQLNFITVFVTLGAQLSRGPICRTNILILQGPNFPGHDLPGSKLPQQHFPGAQFAGAQYAGAQFAEAQFAAKKRKGPNLPRTVKK